MNARPFAVTAIFSSVSFLLGMLMSVQARINGQLGISLGNHVQAALTSFGIGMLSLAVLFVAVPSMRIGIRKLPELLRNKSLLPWHLLGGIAGACFILAQVYSVPLIGVALFTVVGVAAESITALVIDRFGFSPGGKFKLSAVRLAATALIIIGVLLSSFEKLDVLTVSVLALTAVFLARVGTTVQVTLNSKVAVTTNSYLAATFVSFSVGTLFLLAVFSISSVSGPAPSLEWHPWWLYLGGVFGVLAVAGATVCIPRIGVLLYGLAGVGGSIIGSVIIDLVLPFENTRLTTLVSIGSALALAGILIASEPFKKISRNATANRRGKEDGIPAVREH